MFADLTTSNLSSLEFTALARLYREVSIPTEKIHDENMAKPLDASLPIISTYIELARMGLCRIKEYKVVENGIEQCQKFIGLTALGEATFQAGPDYVAHYGPLKKDPSIVVLSPAENIALVSVYRQERYLTLNELPEENGRDVAGNITSSMQTYYKLQNIGLCTVEEIKEVPSAPWSAVIILTIFGRRLACKAASLPLTRQ